VVAALLFFSIARGIPKDIVQLMMGHADEEMTDNYIGMTEGMFNLASEKLNFPHTFFTL
jgi:integrase